MVGNDGQVNRIYSNDGAGGLGTIAAAVTINVTVNAADTTGNASQAELAADIQIALNDVLDASHPGFEAADIRVSVDGSGRFVFAIAESLFETPLEGGVTPTLILLDAGAATDALQAARDNSGLGFVLSEDVPFSLLLGDTATSQVKPVGAEIVVHADADTSITEESQLVASTTPAACCWR